MADLLELSPLTIRKWLRSGKLKGVKKGKEWRVSNEELKVMYPETNFFVNFDNLNPKMKDNLKLAKELYPEKYKEEHRNEDKDKWREFGDKVLEEASKIYPYPFADDEIAYWNADKTNYLEGRDPEALYMYYVLKLEGEKRKLSKMLKIEYGLSDIAIYKIKKLTQGIHLLTCVKSLYKV